MTEADHLRSVPSYGEIVEAICAELEKFNAQEATLSENTDITTDLNVDSVAVMDLLFALEERYDISIPLNELDEVQTIGQLAGVVAPLVRQS